MPDALPPVGVLLAALDPATLPLAGTEEAFVMQGGQPKRTPVSSMGGGGVASGNASITFDYLDNINSPSDVYAPWTFISTNGSATVGVVTITVEFRNALPVAPGFAQLSATNAALPYPPDNAYVYGTVGAFDSASGQSGVIDSGAITISCNAASGSSSVSGAVSFQYTTGSNP